MASVAALINGMGKVPIIGSLDQQLSVMNFMLISFWSHVAKLFKNEKTDVSKVDKMVGFCPGPFQVMDQVSV